jgi:hypothetical protein
MSSGCTNVEAKVYFIKIPQILDSNLSPKDLSGDGRVLVGNSQSIGPWRWTRAAGLERVPESTSIQGAYVDTTDIDGSTTFGHFLDGFRNFEFFKWTNARVNILPAFPPSDRIAQPIEANEDGTALSFFCYIRGPQLTPCQDKDVNTAIFFSPEKTWTSDKGYQNVLSKIGYRVDYVIPTNTFGLLLVGRYYPRALGSIDYTGNYVAFQNPPKGFLPSVDIFTTNRKGTIIVEQQYADPQNAVIWNNLGEIVRLMHLVPRCKSFHLEALDDFGNMYGETICSPQNGGEEGLRITALNTETISEWLNKAGVSTGLAADTEVRFVSDDGKTIFGDTLRPRVLSSEEQRPGPTYDSNVSQNAQSRGYFFFAHVQ